MRYRIVLALLVASALAGCGVRGSGTTGRGSSGSGKPPASGKPPTHHVGCPPEDRQKPVSARHGADNTLVPGHPEAALLCRYTGLNASHRFTLESHRLITTPATVQRLAHGFDAVPNQAPGTLLNCPDDFDDLAEVVFIYAQGPEDPVTVDLSGCGAAGNGHLTRLAGATRSSAVIPELDALLRG